MTTDLGPGFCWTCGEPFDTNAALDAHQRGTGHEMDQPDHPLHQTTHTSSSRKETNPMDEIEDCTCVEHCDEAPKTACRLSGTPHVHPEIPGRPGVYGPCPVHPDRPGDY
ncbi:hypothetical protein [Streptomyces sp. YKOK-I1]